MRLLQVPFYLHEDTTYLNAAWVVVTVVTKR